MQQVGNLISLTLKSKGLKKRYTAESVLYHWPEIVGPELSRQTKAYKIQNSVLVIIVTNSVWCHHLAMMKNEIIRKICTFTQENLVKDIRFLAGVLKNDQNIEQNEETQFENIAQKMQQVHLEKQDLTAARSMVAEVHDENLRKKLLWILEKEFLLKKVKHKEEWHPCQKCGVLCPSQNPCCEACQREVKKLHILSIRKFLLDAPWMNYEEAKQYIECTKNEFYQTKTVLMDEFSREVYRNHADRLKTNTLVMLMTGVKPAELNTELVHHTLKKIRGKKYVPAFRS